MRTKRIGVILAAAGLAAVMNMAGCGGMGKSPLQIAAAPRMVVNSFGMLSF